MQAVAGARLTERGTTRLVTHLRALGRLMREPDPDGLARLEAAIGRSVASHAVALARGERAYS